MLDVRTWIRRALTDEDKQGNTIPYLVLKTQLDADQFLAIDENGKLTILQAPLYGWKDGEWIELL